MKKSILRIISLLLITMTVFYYSNKINANMIIKGNNRNNVTAYVAFRVSESKMPLSGVKIVIIDINGNVVGIEKSDMKGNAIKKLTVPIDKRYYWLDPNKLEARGTVMVIAFKKGYRKTVLFEIPVSSAVSVQSINLFPTIKGGRNEADVQYGNNHHLEIASLVDKYSRYFKD